MSYNYYICGNVIYSILKDQVKELQQNEVNKSPGASTKTKAESSLMTATKIADLEKR